RHFHTLTYVRTDRALQLLLPLTRPAKMSGVWIFDKKGVARLIANPTRESFELQRESATHPGTATAPGARPKVLVYLPANQVIRSYPELEHRLAGLGWTRYHNPYGGSRLLQFHRSEDSVDLISLPENFANLKPFHMYDVVVKNRSFFEVRQTTA
ncbi:hypothetical protein U1Q18_033338, partial [Sarracenia purpurea var. burkii]